MSGVFRKIARVFVEIDDSRTAASEAAPDSAGLDPGADAAELLARLDGTFAPTTSTPAEPSAPPVPSASPDTSSVLDATEEQIFAQQGIADAAGSAVRVTKMLQGLAQFPPAQQLAMVRALDAADDTWSEAMVLTDARARQAALRAHLLKIEQARASRVAAIEQESRAAQATRAAQLTEIDGQIAELTRLREQAVAEAAQTLAGLEQQKQSVELGADAARRRLDEAIARFGALLGFFGGAGGAR